jgi:hypothetical protein
MVWQLKESQLVGASAVDAGAIHQGGVAADDFVETVGTLVHTGDAVGQPAVEFQVQRAQQQRQLLRVRIEILVSQSLLDNLKPRPVNGLKWLVFHLEQNTAVSQIHEFNPLNSPIC